LQWVHNMKDNKLIEFRLAGIKTTEFAKFEKNFISNTEYEVVTNLGFGYFEKENIVEVNAKFTFEYDDKPVIVIAVSCYFQMIQWDEYFTPDTKSLLLPKNFAQHISVITVGTARGILHTKTEGDILNTLILPSINVLELVPDDIIITPN
jgi:hypothetical protein